VKPLPAAARRNAPGWTPASRLLRARGGGRGRRGAGTGAGGIAHVLAGRSGREGSPRLCAVAGAGGIAPALRGRGGGRDRPGSARSRGREGSPRLCAVAGAGGIGHGSARSRGREGSPARSRPAENPIGGPNARGLTPAAPATAPRVQSQHRLPATGHSGLLVCSRPGAVTARDRTAEVSGQDRGSKAARGRPRQVARRTFPPFGYKTAPGIGARPGLGLIVGQPRRNAPFLTHGDRWIPYGGTRGGLNGRGFIAGAPAGRPLTKGTFISRGRGTGAPSRR
jgi:hypothetical protein